MLAVTPYIIYTTILSAPKFTKSNRSLKKKILSEMGVSSLKTNLSQLNFYDSGIGVGV